MYYPHCKSPKVRKNRHKGKQNFYCKDYHKQFQFEYQYQGANPRIKNQIPKMAMRTSGIRDISNSVTTVTSVFRLWFKIHAEQNFQGICENVILNEVEVRLANEK